MANRVNTGTHGSWSKYGGGRGGNQSSTNSDWYCQRCAKHQEIGTIAFLDEVLPGEYIKVCGECILKTQRKFV